MFARSTTVMGDPGACEVAIAYVRDEVMPMLTDMQGCVGLSMMVDRDAGHCIATSSWRSVEEMAATNESVDPMRVRLGQILGGTPEVEPWEVAVMHRDHLTTEAAACRAVWMRTGHADIDRAVGIYREVILPQLEQLPGFCSASLFLNRDLGRCCTTTSFDTREAMEASREQAWAIRDRGVRDAGVDVLDVSEFDLAIAHLRVPEMA